MFDHVAGEGRREFVMSQTAGEGPGFVAREPSGTYPAPVEEELSYALVGVELQDDGALRVFVQSGCFQFCVDLPAYLVVE